MSNVQRLRTVRLYGPMGARFGREFKLAVANPAEAINALAKMIPGFEAYMMGAADHGIRFAVFVGKHNLSEIAELKYPVGNEPIRIAPILTGSKNSGVLSVILGAVLIVVGAAINIISEGALSWLGTPMIYAGVAMIAGGVVQMLAPTPKGTPDDRTENTPNTNFSGPVNTIAQGRPVPLLLGGPLHVGSAVFSAGIVSEDVHVPTGGGTTGSPAGNGGRGGGGSVDFFNQYVV